MLISSDMERNPVSISLPKRQAAFHPLRPNNGCMSMLTSFGEEISQTPLQLAALMSAVANGGTLYYLQYPRTPLEDCKFCAGSDLSATSVAVDWRSRCSLGGRSANSAQASAIAGNIYHELQKSSPVLVSAERQRSRRLRDPPGYNSGCENTEGMSDRKFRSSLSRVGSLFVLGIVAAVLRVWFFRLTK